MTGKIPERRSMNRFSASRIWHTDLASKKKRLFLDDKAESCRNPSSNRRALVMLRRVRYAFIEIVRWKYQPCAIMVVRHLPAGNGLDPPGPWNGSAFGTRVTHRRRLAGAASLSPRRSAIG